MKHISKEITIFTGNKGITTNIYTIQSNNSIICEYFCIGFNNFMLKSKSLSDYTDLFFPNKYEKSDKILLIYFRQLETKNFFYN